MPEDIVYKHLTAGTKLEQVEDDAEGRHLASGAGDEDFALFDASDRIVNKLPLTAMEILLKRNNLLHIPTNTGWAETVTGSGTTGQGVNEVTVGTEATPTSSGKLSCNVAGLGSKAGVTQDFRKINYDKKIVFICTFARRLSDANADMYIQLKGVSTLGILAEKGFGLFIDNLALYGEGYGTSRAALNLSTSLTIEREYQLVIIHYPASKIEWYIDGVLKGTQSNTDYIPSGQDAAAGYFVVAIDRTITTVTNVLHVQHPTILQER